MTVKYVCLACGSLDWYGEWTETTTIREEGNIDGFTGDTETNDAHPNGDIHYYCSDCDSDNLWKIEHLSEEECDFIQDLTKEVRVKVAIKMCIGYTLAQAYRIVNKVKSKKRKGKIIGGSLIQ